MFWLQWKDLEMFKEAKILIIFTSRRSIDHVCLEVGV